MKKLLLISIVLFFVNGLFAQDIILHENIIVPIQIYESDSLDFFIVEGNSRLFTATKGVYKFTKPTIFEELVHDQNGFILGINLPAPIDPNAEGIKNISGPDNFNCKPILEKRYSKKYTYQEIEKCFDIIRDLEDKKGKKLNWLDRGSCDNRAIQAYIKLKKQNFNSLKVIASVSDSIKKCYAPKKALYPLWLYHVANVMYCNDNKYYVLDPFLDKGKPIQLEEWEKEITFDKKDCEKFPLYANNCRVIGRPTVQNNRRSYKWTIGCSCNDAFSPKMIITPKQKKNKNTK